MHPLAGSLESLKDSEIEEKINDLGKKYFMTPNSGVKAQIANLLETYKQELGKRRQAALDKMMSDKSLDKLVKVN
jgi:hypothetical protein